MNIKPIPKKDLIHTCTYQKYLGRDEWGGGDLFAATETLTFVRVEYNKNFRRTTNAEDNLYKALLFFDVVNSNPLGVDFVEKSKITFNGEILLIESIGKLYGDELHHYELGLI